MLEFAYPWLFLLLPAPFFVRWFLPPYRQVEAAVQAPFFDRIAEATGQTPSEGAVVKRRQRTLMILASVSWVLLVVALARPQWVEDPIQKTLSARDLMLAVDLSGSMGEEDFTDPDGNTISRLDAVKLVLSDFIERRESDRIGLIVFGNAPYIQAPFTQDHDTVTYLLSQTAVAMAGPQTMMGDAIGFSIPRFDESKSKNRVLIVLTDGNDTGSRMPPTKAAAIAGDHDVTIHTIAMGDPETVGESAMDEATLEEISKTTGGQAFFAQDRESLESAYQALDELEVGEVETLSYRPRRPLFHYPAAIVVLLFVGLHAVGWFGDWRRSRRA